MIGAIALVAILVVFVPMVLDSEPRPPRPDKALAIPPKDNAPPLPAPPAVPPAPPVLAPPPSQPATRAARRIALTNEKRGEMKDMRFSIRESVSQDLRRSSHAGTRHLPIVPPTP